MIFATISLSSLLPALLLSVPISVLAWAVHRAVPGGILAATAALPLWARLLAGLVVGEIGYYWGHRWSHEIPFLWRFHSIHHSAEHVDFLVNTRAHPLDMVFGRFCVLVPIYVLGLGSPVGPAGSVVPVLTTLIGTVWGFFIHANLRWRFGPLEWLDLHPRIPPLAPHPDRSHQPQLRFHLALDRPDLQDPSPARRRIRPRYGIKAKLPDSLAGQLAYPLLREPRALNSLQTLDLNATGPELEYEATSSVPLAGDQSRTDPIMANEPISPASSHAFP